MLNGFDKYEGRSRSRRKGNRKITVTKNGYINLNAVASENFKDFDFVNLFYNKKEKKIAIEPTNEKQEGSYTLIEQSGSYDAYTIGCTGFLKEFDIGYEVTTRYLAEWLDDEEVLIASLENGEKVG